MILDESSVEDPPDLDDLPGTDDLPGLDDVPPPPSVGSANVSGTCTSPQAKVVDGYSGQTYVNLRVQRNASDTWVCFRVDNPSAGKLGGRVKIADPGGSAGIPALDASSGSCASTSGNLVPGPHPALAGTIEGTPFLVDSYASTSQAMVCLEAGSQKHRVRIPMPGGSAPQVTTELDTPTFTNPTPTTGPVGYPSSTCQTAGEGSNRVINTDAGQSHVWLYKSQPTSSRADVCVRAQGGGLNHGGMLTVDTGALGATPTVTRHDDLTGCDPTTGVALSSPTVLKVHRSNPLGLPASVCVQVGGEIERITVTGGTSPTPPSVKWRSDPGTPVPDVG